MKIINLVALFVLGQCCLVAQSETVEYYQDFSSNDLSDFIFSDSTAWKWSDGALELKKQSDYEPPFRSPFNIALLKDYVVGDFELVLKMKQTGREYNHRDMCIFFGAVNPSNFYYVHLAPVPDDKANNIFIVNDEARKRIAPIDEQGVKWTNDWHTVKIVRRLSDHSIKVYFDDMEAPVLEAQDDHFPVGRIGFGSFDDTGMVDEVSLKGTKGVIRSFF